MTTLTEDDVRRLLDPAQLVTAIESAFRDRYPQIDIPPRTPIHLAGGVFLVMACYDRSAHALGMKLVVVQNNPSRPVDRVQATYLLLDPSTGRPTLTIEANYLTDIRTAAASAVATRFLARDNARALGIFGTGRQARAHLKVIPLVAGFDRALVCGRDHESTTQFAAEMSMQLAFPVFATDAPTCAAESDVICTCTTSATPLFDGQLLRPGTHLNVVGAFQPHTREVDSRTVQRSRVFVDTCDGALAEAGDLLIPISEAVISRDHIAGDLHELTAGKIPGRTAADQITIFKSVGSAIEDLVAAELLQRIA